MSGQSRHFIFGFVLLRLSFKFVLSGFHASVRYLHRGLKIRRHGILHKNGRSCVFLHTSCLPRLLFEVPHASAFFLRLYLQLSPVVIMTVHSQRAALLKCLWFWALTCQLQSRHLLYLTYFWMLRTETWISNIPSQKRGLYGNQIQGFHEVSRICDLN